MKNKANSSQAKNDILQIEKGIYPFNAGDGDLGKHREKSPRVNSQLGKFSLTEKQSKVMGFLAEHIDRVGFPPTVREVAAYFNISAKAAHDHLRAVAKKGYIRLFAGSARGMELLYPEKGGVSENPAPSKKHTSLSDLMKDVITVPLLGRIAAGVPILAEENIETHLTFPKSFLPVDKNLFALQISGDSMKDADILDGDIAIVQSIKDFKTEIKNGDIVAAMIDDNVTLKTYHKKKDVHELHPQNKKYKIIPLHEKDNPQIIAKLVGIFRRY
ncbi:MAG: transcriptional repressor LexA [Spirochaetia bacterium]|nr:transcriptional repressor LexA [Spirochaetia bacterium]